MSDKIFNLDSIRNINANKSYYLSSTTGQIKEAGFWHNVKCFFSATEKAKGLHLMDAIKTALLEQDGLDSNISLEQSMKAMQFGSTISGRTLKDFVTRFRSSDTNAIVQQSARRITEQALVPSIKQLHKKLENTSLQGLKPICQQVFKGLASSTELPTVSLIDEGKVLDNVTFIHKNIKNALGEIEELCNQITSDERLGCPKIDVWYGNYIAKTLFNKDGTRNNKTVHDLKPPMDVLVDNAYKLNENLLNNRPQIVHKLLTKNFDLDPKERLQHLLSLCGKDKRLQDIAIELAPDLILTSNNNVRDDASIRRKLDGLQGNIAEIRELNRQYPGVKKLLFSAVTVMGGTPFPSGLLKDIAAIVNSCSTPLLKDLNGLSSAEDIHGAIEEIRNVLSEVKKRIDIDRRFVLVGEKEAGGPHQQACDMAVITFLLNKLGPAGRNRLEHALRSTEAPKTRALMEMLMHDMDFQGNTNVTDPAKRKGFKMLLEEELKALDDVIVVLNEGSEHPISNDSEPNPDGGDPAIAYIFGTLDDAYAKM